MAPSSRRFVLALRILCLLQAALVLTQATIAGHFLSGDRPILAVHETIGTSVITWVAIAQLLAAVLLWRPGRGPAWTIPVMAALFGTVVLQLEWGFEGRLALHVPVGVALLGAQLSVFAALRPPRLYAPPAPIPHGADDA